MVVSWVRTDFLYCKQYKKWPIQSQDKTPRTKLATALSFHLGPLGNVHCGSCCPPASTPTPSIPGCSQTLGRPPQMSCPPPSLLLAPHQMLMKVCPGPGLPLGIGPPPTSRKGNGPGNQLLGGLSAQAERTQAGSRIGAALASAA